ncbi:glycosyl transferase, group 1 [gamma proteobacterium NOR5-3]|nr:glycosyl transferase, group 1 [gamma proteobacterium NOR5-3]
MNESTLNVLQFICPTGFYGAERWILALVRNLDSTMIKSDLAVTHEDNSQNLELVREYRDQNLGTAFEVPMQHRFDTGVVGRLVALIKERNIHIIHTHGYKSDILGVLAARLAGVKCVTTPHGFENADDLKLRLYIWLGCKAMTRADRVVPLSPQLMHDSRRVGVREDRLSYIQNGVDLSEVEAEAERPRPTTSKKRIGFIGQLISRKNVPDLLWIFNKLWSERDDVELHLLGDGDERMNLEMQAGMLSASPDIHFLGFRDDRLELLHSFDLFVMTSTLEGIPRCLMEACAMGVPVAAYDIPGIDQLIKHEETGLLAPLKDREALAEHWNTILNDQDEAQRLATNAKQYVYDHYAASRMAREYQALFQDLVPS